jgi:hypothetical protein
LREKKMVSRRVLAFGAALGVVAATLLGILTIVDVISMDDLRESLGKTVLVIGVSTLAVVLVLALGRLGKEG